MTDRADMIANVAATTLSLLALLWLVYGLYRDYRTDLFRERMFTIRDHLFDLASADILAFDHPAYIMLRTTINGHIRFGERLNLMSFVALPILLDADDQENMSRAGFQERWDTARMGLDSKAQDHLNATVQEMHSVIADQIVLSSPALVLTVIPVLLFFALQYFWKSIRVKFSTTSGWLRKQMRGLDEIAFAYGEMPQAA